jgi:UDP-N-acetyl-2-amino-2-deoxyglucuronate dehydrogenase
MTRNLDLAVVGCGAIAEWHLDALRSVPEVRVTAAVDVDLARAKDLAARAGAAAFESVGEALAGADFAAALVLVPPQHHEAVAVQLLSAGRHVMLEKPMANTLDECDRILEAADRAGTVFMVAENGQYWPEVVQAQQLIAEDAIGELVTVRACCPIPPLAQFYVPGGWRYDAVAAGGGVTLDTGSHWLRPLRMLMGEIDQVTAAVGHPFPAMEGESLVRSLLRFRSGQVGSFDAYIVTGPCGPEPAFRVTGTAGEIAVDALGSLTLYDAESPSGRRFDGGGGYMASYAAEHRDFVSAVLGGAPLAAGPREALGELRVARAIYRSARSGCWEEVW